MIKVKVKDSAKVKVSVTPSPIVDIKISSSLVAVDKYKIYEGEYTITSSTEDQMLLTKDRALLDNITVLKIPTYEVPNDKGITFYIGGSQENG